MPRLPEPWERAGRGWYVTVNQKQVKLSAKTEADAVTEVEALYNPQPNKPAVKTGTVADLIERFLDYGLAKGLHAKTIRSNRYELRWLVALLGTNASVMDLDADRIGAAARGKGWSDSHVHNTLATIQRFARWAGRADFTLERPAKESRGAEAYIKPDEWERIKIETRGDFHQLLRMLWYTGARPSEIMNLTVEAIDWEHNCAVLKHHKSKKKGMQRILIFDGETSAIVAAQKAKYEDGLLFRNSNGAAFNAQTLAVKLGRVCKRIGIHVTAYHFRHTFATRMLSAGWSDTQVANAMGHKGTRMIHMSYSHVSNNTAMLRELMKAAQKAG